MKLNEIIKASINTELAIENSVNKFDKLIKEDLLTEKSLINLTNHLSNLLDQSTNFLYTKTDKDVKEKAFRKNNIKQLQGIVGDKDEFAFEIFRRWVNKHSGLKSVKLLQFSKITSVLNGIYKKVLLDFVAKAEPVVQKLKQQITSAPKGTDIGAITTQNQSALTQQVIPSDEEKESVKVESYLPLSLVLRETILNEHKIVDFLNTAVDKRVDIMQTTQEFINLVNDMRIAAERNPAIGFKILKTWVLENSNLPLAQYVANLVAGGERQIEQQVGGLMDLFINNYKNIRKEYIERGEEREYQSDDYSTESDEEEDDKEEKGLTYDLKVHKYQNSYRWRLPMSIRLQNYFNVLVETTVMDLIKVVTNAFKKSGVIDSRSATVDSLISEYNSNSSDNDVDFSKITNILNTMMRESVFDEQNWPLIRADLLEVIEKLKQTAISYGLREPDKKE